MCYCAYDKTARFIASYQNVGLCGYQMSVKKQPFSKTAKIHSTESLKTESANLK